MIVNPPDFDSVEALVRAYLTEFDEALTRLSLGFEGRTHDLPSWALTPRKITIGYVPSENIYTIRAAADAEAPADHYRRLLVNSQAELQEAVSPIQMGFDFPLGGGYWMGDARMTPQGDPTVPSIECLPGLLGVIRNDGAMAKMLTEHEAQTSALRHWEAACFGLDKSQRTVYDELASVFARFAAIIKRKAFLERRIHRFINEHRDIMLPFSKSVYYEHPLRRLDGTEYYADFILEREFGQPAWLIELESPSSALFKKNGELTANANHARAQIKDWIVAIEENAANSADAMSFLKGPKTRLVVSGCGLDHEIEMRDSAFADTVTWTYDLLLREAKERAHAQMVEFRKRIGLSDGDVPKFQ
ncbi:MAG TPA: Shedu anti-phage system protein SduA domain-containing protein [Candidatus Baltobacteraceae bacterium]